MATILRSSLLSGPFSRGPTRPWKAAEALFSIEKGQRELLRDAMAAVTGMRPLEDEDRDQLEEIIAAQGDFLSMIRSASGKSCFKFEEDWSMPPGEMKVPNAVAMIQGMRLLGIDAVLKAEAGRVAEALEQCRDGMRLMELRLSHPSIIDYLISIACVKELAACQRAILSGADPKPSWGTLWIASGRSPGGTACPRLWTERGFFGSIWQ